MSAILLAFGAMVAWGLGDFFIQRTVRKIGNLEAMVWVGAICSLMLFPFALKDIHLLWEGENFSFLLLAGLLVFGMSYLAFKGYETGKLSVLEVVSVIELPISIGLGILFFKERPDRAQAVLMAVILGGILLIIKREAGWLDKIKKIFNKQNLLEKGIFFAAAGGVFSALVNFMIAFNSREAAPVLAVWFPWTLFCLFSFGYLYFKRNLKVFWSASKGAKGEILAAGTIDALAWTFFAMALTRKELSITAAIIASYPAVAMFLGVRFNREKIAFYQYAGGIITLAASIIIGLIT